MGDNRKRIKVENFKKNRYKRLAEIKYARNEKNYWPQRIHYYFYLIMLGNGPDFLPFMICFVFELSGGLFAILYIIYCFLFGIPLIYVEIFLGRYTQLTNSQIYRMVPIFFGFSMMILVMNIFYVPLNMVQSSHFFINFMKLLIEPDIFDACPWNADSTCYIKSNVTSNDSMWCNFVAYNCSHETSKKYLTHYIYWKTFEGYTGANYPIWQLLISLIITWLVIGTILVLGMRVIGAMLKASTIITWLMFAIIFIMSLTSSAGGDGLTFLFDIDYEKLTVYKCLIVGVYTVGKLGLFVPIGYMTASAYAKFPKRLGTGAETLLIITLNICLSLFFLIGMFAIAGSLADFMQLKTEQIMLPHYEMYISMVAQFLVEMQCPNTFTLFYFFMCWLLQVIRTTVMIHLIVLNFYDYLPQLGYFPNYVMMSLVGLCGTISLVGSLRFIYKRLNTLVANYIIFCLPVYTFIESTLLFYCYGVERLCDDVHFVTGRRPMKFWLILWYALPFASFVIAISIATGLPDLLHTMSSFVHEPVGVIHVYRGIGLMLCTVFVALIASFFYVVLTFRHAYTNLLKPQFFWGPPKRDARIARKSFAPRTSIRSQPPRKMKQRFRINSIKQMHERDIAENIKRGRIFVDTMYFSNVRLSKRNTILLE